MDIEQTATFVIRVNRDGARPATRENPVSEIMDAGHKSANDTEPFEWSDPTGRVVVKAWPGNVPQDVRNGLRITSGQPVAVENRLVGHYARVQLDASGRGTVQQDPYGLHPLYIGTVHGVSLVANRPHLVAGELEQLTGTRAARDHRCAAWLAFSGRPIGDRTGYEDVSCVPFGATARIDPARGVTFSFTDAPWLLPATDIDDSCIDRIESELITNLRAAIRAVGHTPRLQLTGGRDSRLVLALAVRAGLLQDVEIITNGRADTPDAIVAKDLVTSLGLKHTLLKWDDGVVDRRQMCAHVGRIAGTVGCTDGSTFLSKEGRMTLSGFHGETLRTHWPDIPDYQDLQSVVTGFFSRPSGKAGILQRDAYTAALTDSVRSLLEPAEQMARPEDLFDAYSIQHRVRRWLSARPERLADKFLPLYHPPATEIAFQMDWRERVAGRIHNTIIERAGRLLSEPPYYKPGGLYKPATISLPAQEGQNKRNAGNPDASGNGCQRGLDGKTLDKLISRHVENAFNDSKKPAATVECRTTDPNTVKRQEAYRELIAARDDNPVFDLVDRDRLIDAVNRLPTLNPYVALQVHGAMTGVIWLGRLEEYQGERGRN
ncbi:MAG: hypothetical protein OXI88_08535 [Gammaproteobacteria bacterium]|nr:hypothetical protein [Gammaproteobacteria bacterium]